MNFLQLCQRLITECGISGTLVTTSGAVGEMLRVTNWVNQAWTELQEVHDDWNWMKSSYILGAGMSFQTVAAQASYPFGTGSGTNGVLANAFTKWDRESFRSYSTAAGITSEMFLDHIPFYQWRDGYMLGAMRTVQTRPVVVAVGPDNSICLGPPPNNQYTITGDYWLAPNSMGLDSDAPLGLPSNFHMAIVYKAMEYYAGYESAPEVLSRGQAGYKDMVNQLENLQMPTVMSAGALA